MKSVLLCLIAISGTQMLAQAPALTWEQAARNVSRLPPAVFADVPANVRRSLQQDNCLIPQTPFVRRRHNIVAGEFATRGQRDWAALCSVNLRSRLVVYWGGPAKCGQLGGWRDDIHLLEDYVFAYSVHRITVPRMRMAAREFDAKLRLTHDGINFGSEKGTVAHYCHQGKWVEFITSD
jgi:hypothetical protein